MQDKRTSRKVYDLYRETVRELKKSLEADYQNFEKLSRTEKINLNRAEALLESLESRLVGLQEGLNGLIPDHLKASGKLAYNGLFYEYEQTRSAIAFSMVREDELMTLIETPVAGFRLSERITDGLVPDLRKNIKDELTRGFLHGDNYARVAKRLALVGQSSFQRAMRIVRTETGRVTATTRQRSQSEADQLGIELEKLWVATLDKRTRHNHGQLDGQRVAPNDYFEVNGRKALQPHMFGVASEDINCRCRTISVLKGDDNPLLRRDNETGEVVRYKNYREWEASKNRERDKAVIDVPELPVGIRWNAETGQFEKKGGAGVKTTAEVIKHLEEAKKRNGDRFNAKADRFLDWLKSYDLQDIPRIFQSKEKQIARIVEKVTNLDFTKASANDIIELGSQINKQFKVSEHLGDKEKLKEIFSHFREIGGIVPKETWAKGTNRTVKAQLEEAFSYYPKDWALIPKEHGRQLLARKYDRGFFARGATTPSGLYYDTKYDNYESGFLTIVTNGVRKTTPYHEIGHMVEWANPDLVRIEKEWVEQRTQGEKFVRLSDIFKDPRYHETEITRPDDFISPYIGKHYDESAEVLTMGLQGIFVPESKFTKSIDIKDRKRVEVHQTVLNDPEFLNLIIGLIVKG